jgi:hypothetical protein
VAAAVVGWALVSSSVGPAAAMDLDLCSDGGTYTNWYAESTEETDYLLDLELCSFPDGSATLENYSEKVWRIVSPGDVEMYLGLSSVGAMHRLTQQKEPAAVYVLPNERVVFDELAGSHWYIDPARTTQWLLFTQLVDAAGGAATKGGAYLIGLKSKSASALWKCTTGAYAFGSTLTENEVSGQALIDASLIVGTTAESCHDSWKALLKKTKKASVTIPTIANVTVFAEKASDVNDWTKLLRVLTQACPRWC